MTEKPKASFGHFALVGFVAGVATVTLIVLII